MFYVKYIFLVPGKVVNLTVEPNSNSISLSWINPYEEENCSVSYTIAWKGITDASSNGSYVTEDNSFIIGSLEACVTFEVSVSALCVNCSESETEIINVTTLAAGKLHVKF
jgi:hypothetical protein